MTQQAGGAVGSTTVVDRLAAYGASAAIASGVLSVIGTVFLLLFYALEAPALVDRGGGWVPLGRTNDALIGLTALVAIPLAALLHTTWRVRAPVASNVAFAVAVVTMVATGVIQLIYAANLVSTATQLVVVGSALAGTGAWLVAVSIGRAASSVGGALRWIGVAAGIGYILLFAASVIYSAGNLNQQAMRQNPPLLALFGIAVLASQIGYPVWAIWLGRRLRAEGARGSLSGAA